MVSAIAEHLPTILLGLHKYSERVYDACIVSFCALPITALIDNRFFCVHGGISPALMHLSDIDAVCLLPTPPLKILISCRSRLTVSRSQVPMACFVTCFGRTLCQTTVMSTSRPLMDQGFRPARHSCITKRADAHSSSRQPLRPLVAVCLLNLIPNSYEAVCGFLERNNLLTVIRGHQAQDAGYLSLPFHERCLSLIYP